MTPTTISLSPPKDWNAAATIVARRDAPNIMSSAWLPTPAEREALNNGGVVVLTVWGGHPAVLLSVEAS